jgi:hypothetical protein
MSRAMGLGFVIARLEVVDDDRGRGSIHGRDASGIAALARPSTQPHKPGSCVPAPAPTTSASTMSRESGAKGSVLRPQLRVPSHSRDQPVH